MQLKEYILSLNLPVHLYKECESDHPLGSIKHTKDWNNFTWGEINYGEEYKRVSFRPECDIEKLKTLMESLIPLPQEQ